jgi:hypothetical protein
MGQLRRHSAWQVVAAIAVLFCLLLAVSPLSHSFHIVMGCPVLAVVFLCVIVLPPVPLWRLSQVIQERSPQQVDLPVRSQRPPPSLSK